ncbi:type II toxin-antitoxin system VapC family toxin [Candidatus Nomurabacteria bacterium]|jgi:PIN domain nuclease of toxin-antitoxin system|nr:type II toxin-antitoxin system VapC family toxin [Candidatus Nomurabacteria bacterium]
MNDRILIDSHIFIWYLYEPENLSQPIKDAILNAKERYISTASIWELILKYKKSKLMYDPVDMLKSYKFAGLKLLNISEAHLNILLNIELPHKDPFDEILIAQATAESMSLLTADTLLIKSPYQTIDARV